MRKGGDSITGFKFAHRQEGAKRSRSCQEDDIKIEATCSTEVGLDRQLAELKARNQALEKALRRQVNKTAALRRKMVEANSSDSFVAALAGSPVIMFKARANNKNVADATWL